MRYLLYISSNAYISNNIISRTVSESTLKIQISLKDKILRHNIVIRDNYFLRNKAKSKGSIFTSNILLD